MAREELEAAHQREGEYGAVDRAPCQRKTADERAALAEVEVQRLASVLARQQEEAELQLYRSLAAQEEKCRPERSA